MGYLQGATGQHAALDALIARITASLAGGIGEADARRFTEQAALALTARALLDAGLDAALSAFLTRRIASQSTTLGAGEGVIDTEKLIERGRLAV